MNKQYTLIHSIYIHNDNTIHNTQETTYTIDINTHSTHRTQNIQYTKYRNNTQNTQTIQTIHKIHNTKYTKYTYSKEAGDKQEAEAMNK